MLKKKEPWISVELINGSVVNFNYYHIASVVITRDIKEAIVELEVTLTNGKLWKFVGENASWFEHQWKKIVDKESN